jgi:ATP-dependent DNA helicase DinG
MNDSSESAPPLESERPKTARPTRHFPYAAYRPGQREALEAARQAYKRGKRFVVIEAPTGAGKSGIAVTLGREAKDAYILTAQKILQDQYGRDFPDLAVVKGRANYPCLVMDTHAGAAPCMAGKKFAACEECSYLIAKEDALHAGIATLNYSYLLAEINNAGAFQKRDLLILDEAHNTEDALMRFVEVSLSRATLARAGLEIDFPAGYDLEERIGFALNLIPEVTRALSRLEEQIKILDDVPPDVSVLKNELEGLVRRLQLLRDSEASNWVAEESPEIGFDGGAAWWKFRPVTVSSFAEEFLFQHADRVLMLSATILDAETFLRALGIPLEDAAFIRVPSSFPAKNRPIYPLNVARLNRDSLETELPKICNVIAKLIAHHGNEKGIIHAHSYRILRYLVQNLPDASRLIYHFDSATREDALNRHLETKNPSVLLTPSMTEGVDLADDQARWQIIVKVPYPYLGDPQVNGRRLIDPAWYEWRTALRMVQAYGRAVRSDRDHATTYILDSVFPSWLSRMRQRLPVWFTEAVAPARNVSSEAPRG